MPVILNENALTIYTDGSMFPAPRRGGIGIVFVIVDSAGDAQIIKTFERPGYLQANNQEMELEACIVALEDALNDGSLAHYSIVEVYTDSQYLSGNYKSAMFTWPRTRWKNPVTGRPILHVQQWKRLVKLIARAGQARRRIEIKWVKGHKNNPYNKAADKAAKRSAKNPLNRPLSRVSVRRKHSKKKTELGSVKMLGQRLRIRVITVEYLKSPHRLWKYKYEVTEPNSDFFENVDEIFSEVYLRDGHEYEVLLNEDTANPRILNMIAEVTGTHAADGDTPA